MKFIQRKDGEGFSIKNGDIHYVACCDCGLVHKMAVVSKGDDVGLAFERDEGETNKRRLYNKEDGTLNNQAPIVDKYHRETWGLSKRIEDLLDDEGN